MSQLQEKELAVYEQSAGDASEDGVSEERDWTVDEEKKAKRKLDLILMPLLTLGFFCFQLDRGNIAAAITTTFPLDVGIDLDQFNVGQQLLSLGIVLFEIPSNMILYRVGPGKWLTLQLFLFGLVSTFQIFQNSYGSFLATRFLLGVTEGGFVPGAVWTLTCWYTRGETAKRVAFFYFGNQFATGSAKLLAYGILHMEGIGGHPGWFWLFLLMGALTLLAAFVLGFFLPDSFKNPHSTFLPKWKMFSDREIHILSRRVRLDDPAKAHKKKRIGRSAFKKAFSNWRVWIHATITLCGNGPQRGLDTYAPTVITAFGFGDLNANALASVGLYLQIPFSFALSYISDRWNLRGETVIAGLGMNLIGYVFDRAFTQTSYSGLKYFGIIWTQSFGSLHNPLNATWLSLTCTDPEERSLAMALLIMFANIAGIYGAQLYRDDDAPLYARAFSIAIGILALAVILATIRKIDEIFLRRKGVKNGVTAKNLPDDTDMSNGEPDSMNEKSPVDVSTQESKELR